MSDLPIASDLSYECLQRQRSEPEVSSPALHQPHQGRKPSLITGTRHDELIQRLGGRLPLVNENGDGARHG